MDTIQKDRESLRQEAKVLKERLVKLGICKHFLKFLMIAEAQQAVMKEKSEELSIPSELVSAEVIQSFWFKIINSD